MTGTDTGVGKTWIAAAILHAAGQAGLRTIGLKPLAAGCNGMRDGLPVNEDAAIINEAATVRQHYAVVNPWLLERAIAPHIAAREEGAELSAAALAEHCRSVQTAGVDLIVIEGAGGWLVPLSDAETMADFGARLGAPVILVVDMKLGCLNHALLTAAAIDATGLCLAGWVANCTGPEMEAADANVETLTARLDAPLLGRVPRVDSPAAAAAYLDIRQILDD